MGIRIMVGLALAAAEGAWLFRYNLHTDDTGILVGMILIGSATVAAILPGRWWPAAFAMGACVIASELYRSGAHAGVALVALFVLFVSGVGVGTSAGVRAMMSQGGAMSEQ